VAAPKAQEYSEDARNAQSAAALEGLAEYVEHEDAERHVEALEPPSDPEPGRPWVREPSATDVH
jgi:hypothetical protein